MPDMTWFRSAPAALLALFALPVMGGGLEISDAYARAATPNAKAGAAFFVITNGSSADDRLIAVRTDAAARAELHTHLEDSEGVMRMIEVEDGFAVPAGGEAVLKRGGPHVMLMGLAVPFVQDDAIELVLTFEEAGDISVTVPINNERMDMGGHAHRH